MTQPLDTAYVDIVARDRSLEKLEKDIDKAMKKIDKNFERDLKKIDKEFDDAFEEIDKHFSDMAKTAEKNFDELNDIVENSFKDIDDDVDATVRKTKKKLGDLGDSVGDVFDDIEDKVDGPLRRGMNRLGDLVTGVGTTLGQLGSSIGGAVSSSPLLALILALTPAIIALAAALSQLIGLVGILPSGIGVLLAAILPVVVAFQNFGDAVSAIADGDVEKINEALKKLSPSAQQVAREVGALLPMLRSFQKVVQEGFFAPVVGDFTNVVRTLFPALEKGFFDVARSMGRLTSSFAELAAAPKTFQVINELFASTSRIITNLTGPFRRFGEMLLNVTAAGLPFVERLAAAFGRALDAFSAFVNTSIEDGSFNTFVEDAITTVKELIDLAKALGGLLGTLFAGTEDAGHGLIVTLTDLTIRLDNFLKSAEGQAALKLLVDSVKALGFFLGLTLNTLIFFSQATTRTLRFLENLGRGFVDLVDGVVEWVKKIPEAIETFLGGIPERVNTIFKNMIDGVLQTIGIGIGLIMFAITELPNQIANVLLGLPQRVYDILSQVIPIFGQVFQGAVDFGRNIIVNGLNGIVDLIKSVPERIRGLVPNFQSSGKNLIESFMNGFRLVGSFIGDVAGDIVKSVKGFLNKAIDKINSGIATIDAILPGDLGRIPRLAQGALIRHRPGGILANVGEGSEDEVVAPLSKLEGMIRGGQTINLSNGAVQVNFSGVVPTAEEAKRTGESIIQGMAGALAKHNLRAQVRAI